jgi:hypothetical protein
MMRRIVLAGCGGLVLAVVATAIRAGEGGSCTGCAEGGCVPCCRAKWEEEKTKQPAYEMRCEYACARGRDSWHAPDPECRCRPPCGRVYVKKRLYKSEGEEKVERVPKYEVEFKPTQPCSCTEGCTSCTGGRKATWDPLGLLSLFHHR